MSGATTHVGFVDGDVQPGAAHGCREEETRRASPSSASIAVATRGPDAVVAHQRLAAGLAASEAFQLEMQTIQHAVEVLDDAQRDGDLLRAS
jgi:hypothetical protein